MIMFMGTYEHGLDAKGRVIVPAKLREDLGESFVVTLGLDGCLFAYPMSEWEKVVERIAGDKRSPYAAKAFYGQGGTL